MRGEGDRGGGGCGGAGIEDKHTNELKTNMLREGRESNSIAHPDMTAINLHKTEWYSS